MIVRPARPCEARRRQAPGLHFPAHGRPPWWAVTVSAIGFFHPQVSPAWYRSPIPMQAPFSRLDSCRPGRPAGRYRGAGSELASHARGRPHLRAFSAGIWHGLLRWALVKPPEGRPANGTWPDSPPPGFPRGLSGGALPVAPARCTGIQSRVRVGLAAAGAQLPAVRVPWDEPPVWPSPARAGRPGRWHGPLGARAAFSGLWPPPGERLGPVPAPDRCGRELGTLLALNFALRSAG